MSSNFVTAQEAAKTLSVSTRTISTYVNKGYLTATKRKGSNRKFFLPEEVEELRISRMSHSPVSAASFRRMESKIRRLESQVDTLMRVLDTRDNPLNMSLTYAKELYTAISDQLKRGNWTEEEIAPWAEIFMRINEDDLRKLSIASEDPKPWTVLFRLCVSMISSVVSNDSYKSSLGLQQTHRTLGEARRRLRVSALCYADLYSTDMDRELRRFSLADSPLSVRDATVSALP